MTKVYLLLRENKQTGPFSLEELLQQNLTFLDLVWVDGQSYGWSYPAEIEELRSYVRSISRPEVKPAPPEEHEAYLPSFSSTVSTTAPPSSRIYVSLPKRMADEPAREAASQKDESEPELEKEQIAAPHPQEVPAKETLTENRQREPQPKVKSERPPEIKSAEPENDYTNWYYKQNLKKKKSANLKNGIAGTAILLLFAYAGFSLLSGNSETKSKTSPAEQKIAYEATMEQVPETGAPAPLLEEEATSALPHQEAPKEKKKEIKPEEQPKKPSIIPIVNREVAGDREPLAEPETEIPAKEELPTKATENRTSSEGKKKKLGESISGIFDNLKKKKNEDPEVEEEPKPAKQQDGSRTATRRGEQEPEKSSGPSLAGFINLKPSEKPDNWMMGVVGMKLTLYNNSTETIKTATVEVSYYGEQKNLLEKRIIKFNNVGPRRTLTMPVPDNRMADRAEYKVISASSKEDDYAKWD